MTPDPMDLNRSAARASRGVRSAVMATALSFAAAGSFAQNPVIGANPAPTSSFVGEQVCFDVPLTHNGTLPGFGPYLQFILEPGLTFDGSSLFGVTGALVAPTPTVVPGSGSVTDPISGSAITATPGYTVVVVRLPVGSVVDGGPTLNVETCVTVDSNADPYDPLDFSVTPAYEFGDSPTGPPVVYPANRVDDPILPTIARLTKVNVVPEDERPPGPTWPYTYELQLDIADGVTLTSLDLLDTLPSGLTLVGVPTVTGGSGCAVNGTIDVDCTSATGGSGMNDVVISYDVVISDILDEDTCNVQPLANTGSFDATYTIPSTGATNTISASEGSRPSDAAVTSVEHVVVQKGVTPGMSLPGDVLNYTVEMQVTDFDDVSSLVYVDTLPDGVTNYTHTSLIVGGTTVPIVPTTASGPNPGETVITYDIGTAAATVPVAITAGSTVAIAYTGEVAQSYPGGTSSVLARDVLTNTGVVTFDLSAGAAAGCIDSTAASTEIQDVSIDKSISSSTPGPYQSGDTLTYVIGMDIPSGDVDGIILTDFFPLPVFDVDDATFGVVATFGTTPGVRFGPGDNVGATPTITIDGASNSAVLTVGDVSRTAPGRIEFEIDIRVNDIPFADGLLLQNLFEAMTDNTGNDGLSDVQPTPISLEAPELEITKGVFATGGDGAISPGPGSLPVDGNLRRADAGDTVTYQITLENVGAAEAYDVTISDPGIAGFLTGCVVDSVTVGASTLGAGTDYIGDLFTTPIVLSNNFLGAGMGSLTANDDNPMGGGPPYGDDTVLVRYSCDLDASVQPRQFLVNTAQATWTSGPGGTTYAPVMDDAQIEIDRPTNSKQLISITPNHTGAANTAQVGEILRYQVDLTLPEGTYLNSRFEDVLDRGLAFVDVVSVSASPGVLSNGAACCPAPVISNQGGGVQNLGRRLDMSFGTLTNTNTDDGVVETLTVIYDVVVLNWTGNNRGDRRNNRSRFVWQNANGGTQYRVQRSGPNVRLVEPEVDLIKDISPAIGIAGTNHTVTLTVENTAPSNATAFDVELFDDLNLVTPGALLNYVGSSLGTGTCPNPPTAIGVAGGIISATWDVLPLGGSCEVTFDVMLDPAVNPGVTYKNTAEIEWHSLDAEPGIQSTHNPLSTERTGDPADNPSDPGANDHRTTAMDDVKVQDVTLTKSYLNSTETTTGSSAGMGTLNDLTIGEVVTFRLTVVVPPGTVPAPGLTVFDTLPFAPGTLEALSGTATTVPSGAGISVPSSTVTVQDLSPADGINDTVRFEFGQVVNPGPGDITFELDVEAVVLDLLPQNTGVTQVTNTALVQFGPGLEGGDTLDVEIVEPLLQITKAGDATVADGGDLVTFQLLVEHLPGSSADAFGVMVSDPLIAGELAPFGIPVVVGGSCTDAPDTGPAFVGATVEATFDNFPFGASCLIEYQATLDAGLSPGQTVTNVADLNWSSLDPANDPEGEARSYSDDDDWEIVVSQPGVTKIISSSTVAETEPPGFKGPSEDLTIGEQVTFQMTVTFPDALLLSAEFEDDLPSTAVELQYVTSQIVSVGGDLSLSSGLTVGSPATIPGDPSIWALGDVTNTPDTPSTVPADNQIVFEVTALVTDVGTNQGAPGVDTGVLNVATLTASNLPGPISGSVPVDIVEPELTIDKTPVGGDPLFVNAGDTVTFVLTIEHTADSTADAWNLSVADSLTLETTFGALQPSSTCPNVAAAGGPVGPITFTADGLQLALMSCTIVYTVDVDALAPAGAFVNTADLTYESLDGGGGRQGAASDDGTLQRADGTFDLLKQLTSTNNPDTVDPEVAIGELMTYTLQATIPEGQQDFIQIQDIVNQDRMMIIGGRVVSLGNNLTTTLPGTPTIGGAVNDLIRFNFGTVFNTADAMIDTDDVITVEVTAVVTNFAPNNDGNVLNNRGRLFGGAPGALVASDNAETTIVEPELMLTKNMALVNGLIEITLQVANTGTAPAYDVELTDVLDDTWFVQGSALPVTVPSGWALSETTATPVASQTTVTIGLASPPVPGPTPDQVLDVGETETFVFSMQVTPGIVAADLPVENNLARVEGSSMPGPNPDERIGDESVVQNDINDTATDTLDLPLLDVVKTASPSPANAGQTVTYTITVSNTGTAAANNIVVTDAGPVDNLAMPTGWVIGSVGALPGGTVTSGNTLGDTAIGATFPQIPAMDSVTVIYDVSVPNPLAAGVISITNQATADSDETPPANSDDDPINGPSENPTTVPLVGAPDLTIVKDDGGASSTPGGTVTYTLDYSNVGTQNATGVVLTETVPVNTTSGANPGWEAGTVGSGTPCDAQPAGTVCVLSVGALAGGAPAGAGSTGSASFALIVDNPLPGGVTQVANQAQIADDGTNGADPNPGNNMDPDTTPVSAAPDLVITKDDGGVSTTPGGAVTYALMYSNVGLQTATGVVLTETVPANTTSGPNPGWEVSPVGSGTPCAAQLAGTVCVLSVGTVAGGGGSGSAAFSVVVEDPLTSGVTQIANAASIADDGTNGTDPTPGNNTDPDTTPVNSDVDLVITKDDGGVSTAAGGTVTYTLNYSNVGTQSATGVVVAETVPANTVSGSNPGWEVAPAGSAIPCDAQPAGTACVLTVGAMAGNGGAGSAAFQIVVDDPLPAGADDVSNVASIDDDGTNGPDGNPGNNSDPDDTPIDAAPDLVITKDDGGLTLSPGADVPYVLDIENVGDQDATGVVVTETVPANTTFAAASSTGTWVCAPNANAGSVCTQSVGTLAAAGMTSVTFAVTIDDPLAAGVTQITNTATVADDGTNGPDPTPINNSDPDDTPVNTNPVLDATKADAVTDDADGSGTLTPGDTVTYTVTLQATGNAGTQAVVFTDTPDVNTTLTVGSVTTSQGTINTGNSGGDSTIAVDVGDIASGVVVTITFDVTLNNPLPAGLMMISNQGVADTPDAPGGVPTDDPDTPAPDDPTVTPLVLMPMLDADKTVVIFDDVDASTNLTPGDVLLYTVVVTNVGTVGASNVSFTDVLDLNTTLNVGSVTTTIGSVAIGNVAGDTSVAVAVGTLQAAESVTVTFEVTVNNPLVPADAVEIRNQGTVSADDIPNVLTDDPGAPGGDDPTTIPLAPTGLYAVPTLGEMAMGLMILLLAFLGVGVLRRTGLS